MAKKKERKKKSCVYKGLKRSFKNSDTKQTSQVRRIMDVKVR